MTRPSLPHFAAQGPERPHRRNVAVPLDNAMPVTVPPERVRLERAQLRRLRLASLAEAATLLALVFVAVPLKHFAGRPAAAAVLGPVHGLVFLAYCWVAVETVAGGGWTRREVGRLFVAAVVPFGGLTNGPLLRRKAAALAR